MRFALFLYSSKHFSSHKAASKQLHRSLGQGSMVRRSRRGVGCLVWKNKKELIKEAFTNGEEKRTCGVHVAVIIRLGVSN